MIIKRVRRFVQKSGPALLPLNLKEVVAEVLPFVRLQAPGANKHLIVEIDEPSLPVVADRVLLQQILLDLTENAFQATSNQQTESQLVVISARRSDVWRNGGADPARAGDRGSNRAWQDECRHCVRTLCQRAHRRGSPFQPVPRKLKIKTAVELGATRRSGRWRSGKMR